MRDDRWPYSPHTSEFPFPSLRLTTAHGPNVSLGFPFLGGGGGGPSSFTCLHFSSKFLKIILKI